MSNNSAISRRVTRGYPPLTPIYTHTHTLHFIYTYINVFIVGIVLTYALCYISGHLHLIGGKCLHLVLQEMRLKYGDVFKLQLGSKTAIVLSSRKVIKEAYIKQAKTFAGRPNLPTFERTRKGQTGLSLCDYTKEFKNNNRIAVAAIHNFLSNESNLDELLRGEASKMTRLFDKYANSNESFSPEEMFHKIVPSTFVAMMFRRQYEYDDPSFISIVDAYKLWFQVAEADNPADFFPFMQYFPNERLDTVGKCSAAFESFNMSFIDQIDITDQEDESCLFNVLVMQYTNRNKTVLTLDEKLRLAKIVSDLVGGGFDTVSSTLSWAMLYLTNQPDTLQTCRDEIIKNTKLNEELSVSDMSNLPYFCATIYEILRLSTVAPLALAREVTKDTNLMGYDIPKGTMVLPNLWQINHDPERWDVPEHLHPDHFLDEDNKLDNVSVREMMSFSTGARHCPGKQIAISMMFILLGNIIRHYEISITQKPIDMVPQRGLTLKPKYYTMALSRIEQ